MGQFWQFLQAETGPGFTQCFYTSCCEQVGKKSLTFDTENVFMTNRVLRLLNQTKRNTLNLNQFLFLVLTFLSFVVEGQQLTTLAKLDNSVNESSGLIYLDERIITHNDSGGEAALYEIDEETGEVTRKVTISNASNRDWEDIGRDESFIYIGDFGNNNGTRRDLKIYKVGQSDYLDADNQAIAEVIEFSYEDQTDFTSSPMDTNFDAEALIAYGDNLYVFTKNWIDNRSHVYKIPKTVGTHVATRFDELDSDGLVTGAAYNSLANRIILVGYDAFSPFLIEISDFSGEKFSSGILTRYDLDVPFGDSFQIEAVTFTDQTRHVLSSEANFLGDAALMEIVLSTLSLLELDAVETLIYPNPARDQLWIDVQSGLKRVEIFDFNGKLILEKTPEFNSVDLGELPSGHYLIRLYSDSGMTVKKLLRE
jgi:hypothetical protein